MSEINGRLVCVVSCPSYRDTIYVGTAHVEGVFLRVDDAWMVVRYRAEAAAGITSNPKAMTRIRKAHTSVWVPFTSIASIGEVDAEAWEERKEMDRDLE